MHCYLKGSSGTHCLLAYLLLSFAICQAQGQSGSGYFSPDVYEKYRIDHYDTEDGFIQNGVVDMLLGPQDYLWVNNQSGLIRMDGQRERFYYSGNTSFLKGRRLYNPGFYLEDGSLIFRDLNDNFLKVVDTELQPAGQGTFFHESLSYQKVLPGISVDSRDLEIFDVPDLKTAANAKIIRLGADTLYVEHQNQLYYFENGQLIQQLGLPNREQRSDLFVLKGQLFYINTKNQLRYFKIDRGIINPGLPLSCADTGQPLICQNDLNIFVDKTEQIILVLDGLVWLVRLMDGQLKAKELLEQDQKTPNKIIWSPKLNRIFISDSKERRRTHFPFLVNWMFTPF